jgi:hypothetical protein
LRRSCHRILPTVTDDLFGRTLFVGAGSYLFRIMLKTAELDATSGIVNMPRCYRDLRCTTMLAAGSVCDTRSN